jgi:hypothetical protein
MTQHRSPNRAARHLLDLDARYRERLHRGHPSATVETTPADGTLLDVVPLPDTGKVLMIVAHVVPASAAMPGSPPENSPPDEPGAAPPDPAPVPGEGSDATAPAGVRPRPAAPIRPAPREPAPEPGALPDGLRIDEPSRRVWVDDREVGLTYQEFELLVHFTTHPWKVFSRAQLMQELWPTVDATTRTVDVHVHRLRRKLGRVGDQLATVRRVGYVYRPRLVNRAELAPAGE